MINFNWPQTADNDYVPWYVIVWRAPWVVVMFAGRVVFAVGVAGCYLSLKEGRRAFDSTG